MRPSRSCACLGVIKKQHVPCAENKRKHKPKTKTPSRNKAPITGRQKLDSLSPHTHSGRTISLEPRPAAHPSNDRCARRNTNVSENNAETKTPQKTLLSPVTSQRHFPPHEHQDDCSLSLPLRFPRTFPLIMFPASPSSATETNRHATPHHIQASSRRLGYIPPSMAEHVGPLNVILKIARTADSKLSTRLSSFLYLPIPRHFFSTFLFPSSLLSLPPSLCLSHSCFIPSFLSCFFCLCLSLCLSISIYLSIPRFSARTSDDGHRES